MAIRVLKQLKAMSWSETAFSLGAALFMLFLLAFASSELLVRPGALFRKLTPPLSSTSTEGVPADAGAETESTPLHASDPYASVLDSFKSEQTRQKEEEESHERARRALENSIKNSLARAQEKLGQLTRDSGAFEREVVEVVGTSLDADHLTDDFARLVATQRTVAEAWASIKNDRVSHDAIESFRTSVDATAARTQAGTFLEEYRERLAGLIKSLDSKLANQKDLESSLDHIRAMLEADRFKVPR